MIVGVLGTKGGDSVDATRMAGQIGSWSFVEDSAADLYCADVVRGLAPWLAGMRGVCTSWDSGTLDSIGLQGWGTRGGLAVSPLIGPGLAEGWPESSCGFDEWYFFGTLPAFERLRSVCNWGIDLEDTPSLVGSPTGFDLQAQLDFYQPRAVIGDGRRIFVITRDQGVIDEFLRLCDGPRTRA